MSSRDELSNQVKQAIVEDLMLKVSADQIQDHVSLFGAEGLGLDSIDALQLVVTLEKRFGLQIKTPEAGKEILVNINTIVDAIQKNKQG